MKDLEAKYERKIEELKKKSKEDLENQETMLNNHKVKELKEQEEKFNTEKKNLTNEN